MRLITCDRNTLIALLGSVCLLATGGMGLAAPLSDAAFKGAIVRQCADCHDAAQKIGALDLGTLVEQDFARNSSTWEKVLRLIAARQMPPLGEQRPTDAEYEALESYLASKLDAAATAKPNAGRVDTFRRLNRTEYQNAIRDLLALDVDAAALLPPDESSHGFDHITVGDLSPGLLTRYVQAAQKLSRLAVGAPLKHPDGTTYRIKADTTQEDHVPGLPLGTRGGGVFQHSFPNTGEYEIQIRLTRDRNDDVEGLHGAHQLEILLDKERVAGFDVLLPKGTRAADYDDTKLRTRVKVSAGPHDLGMTFIRNGSSIEETTRQPLNVHFNLHRHPRLSPAIYQVSITGPFATEDSPSQVHETPSRQRIFTARPGEEESPEAAAEKILTKLARAAYRRPLDEADLARLLGFFREANKQDGFEAGIESALGAILTSPSFLFKIEQQPAAATKGKPYEISSVELASRLSFFLWSSIPDQELLALAEEDKLRQPAMLAVQVKRMLADKKSSSLATNFASQWLHLRNLDSITPDGRLFPDFDDNLRQAMRQETELHVQRLLAADRSVLSLIQSQQTFLNERLAKHYGIPHIYGNRFREVELPRDSQRGGLLRQGSILTVTSYATRTSPVIRGNWILENILGAPAPPPPQNVPALDETVISDSLTVRERLAKHRADAACARCHNLMDPIGFALENFDAVGRWRDLEAGRPVDAAGGLPDGSSFVGVAGLETAILKRPQVFVTALTESLATFALGRGLELSDGPAIRQIVRQAANEDYRISAVILGIVSSGPFQTRNSQ